LNRKTQTQNYTMNATLAAPVVATPVAFPPAPAVLLMVKGEDHKKLTSFVNADKGALLSSLYLRRAALPGIEMAREIRVTIEVVA
jgi:hypothetical protein